MSPGSGRATETIPERGGMWGALSRVQWWHLIAVLIIVAGVVMTAWTAQQQDRQLRAELLAKARIAADSIDPATVAALSGSPADLGSPAYEQLKARLIRIHMADPTNRFAYLMGLGPDGVFIYVDSEPPDSPDYSPPGQFFAEVSPGITGALSDGRPVTEGPYSDRWGTWVSGIVPITDPATHRVVALYGMDVDATTYYYTIAQACAAIVTATLLILLLLITFALTQLRNRQEQERLAASEEKFSRAFHANPALMAITTIDKGRVLDVNEAFVQALGYTRDEVIGKTIADLGLYVEPGIWGHIEDRVVKDGQVRNLDLAVFRKDGGVLHGLFSAMMIEVAGTLRLLTVMLDITERKRAEDALRKANQKLGVLTQLTRKDLLNEVFILNGYLDLVTRDAAGQDRILNKIGKGEQAAKSINEITQFIQDYQDLGAEPPVWQNVRMAAMFGLSHIEKGATRFDLETGNLEIYADALLERVWQGLFENVIMHGGHATRVRVWHTTTTEGIMIIAEDDGTGIPHDRKQRIFLHGNWEGTGVRGLFFIREILDITGITIRETGEPGTGARFEILVPTGGFRFRDGEPAGTDRPPGSTR